MRQLELNLVQPLLMCLLAAHSFARDILLIAIPNLRSALSGSRAGRSFVSTGSPDTAVEPSNRWRSDAASDAKTDLLL